MYIQQYQDGITYDVIGDIHGHYDELVALLKKLGYAKEHSDEARLHFNPIGNRRLIFIGDYIDRGPKNLMTIDLIAMLVEEGVAQAIMGNHDFNAVHYATERPDRPGEYLRPHNEKNRHQHVTFLEEVENSPWKGMHEGAIEWFKSLPVFLKIGNFNFIHACWQPSAIEELIAGGFMSEKGIITEKGWIAADDEKSPAYQLFETLLKGPEENIANDHSFEDAHGIKRTKGRIAWWKENPATYSEAYASLPPTAAFLSAAYQATPGGLSKAIRTELLAMPPEEKIFIGHIWERGTPKPLSERVVTVDYSVALGDKLASYAIKGLNITLSADDFTWVDAIKAPQPKTAPEPAI